MKIRIAAFLILIASGGGMLAAGAQSLVITGRDGTETSFLLSSLRSFTFSNGNFLLRENSGLSDLFSLSEIQKISFADVATSVSGLSSGEPYLYPNPAGPVISLKNLGSEQQEEVVIYRSDGAAVLVTQLTADDNTVDISRLQKGLYILTAGSRTFRFIKL